MDKPSLTARRPCLVGEGPGSVACQKRLGKVLAVLARLVQRVQGNLEVSLSTACTHFGQSQGGVRALVVSLCWRLRRPLQCFHNRGKGGVEGSSSNWDSGPC